jgi:hypothetical protein
MRRDELRLSGSATAHEWGVVVVELVGNVSGARCGNKTDFAHQVAAPVPVHLRAEFAAHRFELELPRFAVRGDFQASGGAADGAGVRSDCGTHDLRPHAGEPRECSFRPLHLAQHAA